MVSSIQNGAQTGSSTRILPSGEEVRDHGNRRKKYQVKEITLNGPLLVLNYGKNMQKVKKMKKIKVLTLFIVMVSVISAPPTPTK